MYVCGMTVYDYCHIGHARMLAAFDVIVRVLRAMNYQVTYVRNITDIDDKIINRANENHEDFHALTERFIRAMHEDIAALTMLPPDQEPRATAYIPQMIELIEKLIQRGLAYAAPNGDVYYDVSEFPTYGQLSGQDLENLRAGARIAVAEEKNDALDFVLWKAAKPGEPSWPSPWGNGRPGWHIECSAMSCQLLGHHFDIHGGGMDLLFPHHENEVAQSVGGYQCQFANVWMHNGFIQVNEEKMSKSLGNFFTIRDVLKHHSAEALRYFLISSHYRSPINYTDESLTQAAQSLERIYTALRDCHIQAVEKPAHEPFTQKFFDALADDINTPQAFAVIFELVREVNRLKTSDTKLANAYAKLLHELCGVLGIAQQDPEAYFQAGIDVARIEALIEKRQVARAAKDWASSDQIRDELTTLGISLEDTPQGVKWKKT
jgi:cysteinyl-tRNA synthetase